MKESHNSVNWCQGDTAAVLCCSTVWHASPKTLNYWLGFLLTVLIYRFNGSAANEAVMSVTGTKNVWYKAGMWLFRPHYCGIGVMHQLWMNLPVQEKCRWIFNVDLNKRCPQKLPLIAGALHVELVFSLRRLQLDGVTQRSGFPRSTSRGRRRSIKTNGKNTDIEYTETQR